ncbi:hypothetical protein [Kitasatospora sp. NPDC091276]|uniref:hypothetical protein n=1 Tax=Kitasatospora sp. NPDC091276 TaxID=3155300 RepID=UPI003435A58E
MTSSLLSQLAEGLQAQAKEACAELRGATKEAGCPLPSLSVDPPSIVTGRVLVNLGSVMPETALRLAEVIRAGVDALAAEDRRTGAVTPLGTPRVGDPVVDLSAGVVGAYQGRDGDRWQLAPLTGGEPWLADPEHVRTATVNELVRDGMTGAEPAADAKRAG